MQMSKLKIYGIALLAYCLVIPAVQAQDIGRVIAARGQVMALFAGKTRSLQRNSVVQRGDEIKTGAGSSARLRLSDNSIIELNANSTFIVNNYRYQPRNPGSNRFAAKLLGGRLRTATGAIARLNRSGYRLDVGERNKKPVAVIGVRGTDFMVNYTSGTLTISVTSGSILVNQQTVNAGQTIRFRPNAGYGTISVTVNDQEVLSLDESELGGDTEATEDAAKDAAEDASAELESDDADTGGLTAPEGITLSGTQSYVIPDTSGGNNPLDVPVSVFVDVSKDAASSAGAEFLTGSITETGNVMGASQ